MAKERSKSSGDRSALNLLRTGGEPLPADIAGPRTAAVKEGLAARFDQRQALSRQTSKLWNDLHPAELPSDRKALSGLLGVHKKLAGTKLAAPKLGGAQVGGLIYGQFTVTVTPPFDYAITIPTTIQGHPQVSGSCNTNGNLDGRAVSDSARGFNAGSWYSEMGIYFHPLSAGTVRLSASPSFSFQWWTNSLNNTLVRSFGAAELGVFTLDRMGHVGGGPVAFMKQWDEQSEGEIHFDFGSGGPVPLSVQFNVSPTLIYAMHIALDVHVEAMGWPGSLAGAALSVNVPSFTYQFDLLPVFAQK